MNSRAVLAGAFLIAILVGAGLWLRREPRPADVSAAPNSLSNPAGALGNAESKVAALPPTVTDPAAPGRSQEPAAPIPTEIVEPLLELNYADEAGRSSAVAQTGSESIDELLAGKHAGKTRAQLQASFDSVAAVLELQKSPDQIPKDKILSPEALAALGIEAAWLKEQIFK